MPLKLPSFRARRDVYPPDLWTKCPTCETMLFNKQLDKNLRVCPTCGHHFRLSAAARLEQLARSAAPGRSATPGLQSVDALGFVDQKPYPDRLAAAQAATGMRDAAVWGTGAIGGTPVAICVMDFGFMGGSMGAVVGEKVTRAAEHALAGADPADRRQRLGRRADAGGHAGPDAAGQDAGRARAAARRRRAVHLASCPTRRPAACSPRSPRSATSTSPSRTRSSGSPARASSAGTIAAGAAAGLPARRVPVRARLRRPGRRRPELRDELVAPAAPAAGPRRARSPAPPADARHRAARLPAAVVPVARWPSGSAETRPTARRSPTGGAGRALPSDGDPRDDVWARVQLARNLRRPRTLEFVAAMTDEFVELHGDRLFGDDAAIVAGLARIDGRRVVVIGQQKGADTDENIRRNFGMPHPEGYRKAMRVMELAERVRAAGRHLRRRARAPTRARSPRSAASPRRSPARSA